MTAQLMKIAPYAIGANGAVKLQIPGTYFQIVSSSSDVTVTFYRNHSPIGKAINVPQAFEFGPIAQPFDRVDVESVAAQTVELCIARETARLNRLSGEVDAHITKGATLDSLPDDSIAAGATEQVAAADSDRRAILVTNLPTNTDLMRVGDSGAGAANGTPFMPGETVTLETSAPVYVYNSGAGAQSVAITLIKD